MNYELIYDTATMSTAPFHALVMGGGILAGGGIWAALLRWRAHAVHAGAKFVLFAGALVVLISGGLAGERWWLARRTDYQTVEGMVSGHWTKEVRERRSPSSSYQTTRWEGFSINGVPFVYALGVDQNYFHNSGSRTISLQDGMILRLRYFTSGEGPKADHQIVRVEQAR